MSNIVNKNSKCLINQTNRQALTLFWRKTGALKVTKTELRILFFYCIEVKNKHVTFKGELIDPSTVFSTFDWDQRVKNFTTWWSFIFDRFYRIIFNPVKFPNF